MAARSSRRRALVGEGNGMMGRSAWPSIIAVAVLLSWYEAALARPGPGLADAGLRTAAPGAAVPGGDGDDGPARPSKPRAVPATKENSPRRVKSRAVTATLPSPLPKPVGLADPDDRWLTPAADGDLADPEGELTAARADGLDDRRGASRPSRAARRVRRRWCSASCRARNRRPRRRRPSTRRPAASRRPPLRGGP